MNQNEIRYFNEKELSLYDVTSLPIGYLLKSLFIKMRRRTWGGVRDQGSRLAWTATAVSDAVGPADNVRNYMDRQTIRSILAKVNSQYPIRTACEVGCGYGRVTMVLGEFAEKVVGFERESHLVEMARSLLPAMTIRRVDSLDTIRDLDRCHFDFVMTCTVLQHLNDDFCASVLEEMKRLAPEGHVLIIEKTEDIGTTRNTQDGNSFLSRARSPQTYGKWMEPYKLVSVSNRVVEPGYYNVSPGKCMLFKSPLL